MSDLEEAQKRIAACRRDRAVKFDLIGLKLGTVPDEVFELTWLNRLNVYGCSLLNFRQKLQF